MHSACIQRLYMKISQGVYFIFLYKKISNLDRDPREYPTSPLML